MQFMANSNCIAILWFTLAVHHRYLYLACSVFLLVTFIRVSIVFHTTQEWVHSWTETFISLLWHNTRPFTNYYAYKAMLLPTEVTSLSLIAWSIFLWLWQHAGTFPQQTLYTMSHTWVTHKATFVKGEGTVIIWLYITGGWRTLILYSVPCCKNPLFQVKVLHWKC